MAAMSLSDGSVINLNSSNDPVLAKHLARPGASVKEMISQINERNYYAKLFDRRRDLVFLDLGANLGLVSLFARPACRRIVAVEAEPYTYRMLTKVVTPYGIECVHAALWKSNKRVPIAVDESFFSRHTIINAVHGQKKVNVRGLAFFDLLSHCRLDHVDVCKVDVEGSEMCSLTTEVFSSGRVSQWYIEVHKTQRRTRDQSMKAMQERISQAGLTFDCPRPNALRVPAISCGTCGST